MKQLFFLVGFVCLAAMILPACAPGPEQQTEPVAEEASTEADVEAIKNCMDDWDKAVAANDVDRIMSLFADDIIYMPPNAQGLTGKPAARAFSDEFFGQFTVDEADFVSKEVKVCGDWSMDRGTYVEKWTPKAGGESIQEVGKYIAILEKQADGSWKYTHVIWNSDNPLTQEPAT